MEQSTRAITIEDFIRLKNPMQINYDRLSIFERDEYDNKFLLYNLLNDYYDELIDLSIYIKLKEDEYRKYRLRPKLLAYRIYGDPEMYYILLLLNNISNIKDFDFKRVRVLKPNDLNDILSSVYNSCSTLLQKKNGNNL